MEYELLQRYPRTKGEPSLPVGTIIKPVTVNNESGFFGYDNKNFCWTPKFVQKRTDVFKPRNK